MLISLIVFDQNYDLSILQKYHDYYTNYYSYLSNKRSPTIILFGKIFQALRSYQRPCVYLFLKKLLKNWVKIEKIGYFQKLLYIALQKFQALHKEGPDPSFIFFRLYDYSQPFVY